MNQIESKLTPRQQKLLIELVRTTDIKAAAAAAGVGRTTAYRWLEMPAFSEELIRRRNQTMNEALSSIQSLTAKAARELGGLLDSENEGIRRMVCKDILGHAVRVRELEEIERRISALEKQQTNQPGGNR